MRICGVLVDGNSGCTSWVPRPGVALLVGLLVVSLSMTACDERAATGPSATASAPAVTALPESIGIGGLIAIAKNPTDGRSNEAREVLRNRQWDATNYIIEMAELSVRSYQHWGREARRKAFRDPEYADLNDEIDQQNANAGQLEYELQKLFEFGDERGLLFVRRLTTDHGGVVKRIADAHLARFESKHSGSVHGLHVLGYPITSDRRLEWLRSPVSEKQARSVEWRMTPSGVPGCIQFLTEAMVSENAAIRKRALDLALDLISRWPSMWGVVAEVFPEAKSSDQKLVGAIYGAFDVKATNADRLHAPAFVETLRSIGSGDEDPQNRMRAHLVLGWCGLDDGLGSIEAGLAELHECFRLARSFYLEFRNSYPSDDPEKIARYKELNVAIDEHSQYNTGSVFVGKDVLGLTEQMYLVALRLHTSSSDVFVCVHPVVGNYLQYVSQDPIKLARRLLMIGRLGAVAGAATPTLKELEESQKVTVDAKRRHYNYMQNHQSREALNVEENLLALIRRTLEDVGGGG